MSVTTVTVTGKYLTPAGAAEVGTVAFTLSAPIMDAAGKVIRTTATTTATLDVTGAFSLALPANDDAGTVPTGTTYSVVEQMSHGSVRAYSVVVPHTAVAGTVDVTALAPVANSSVVYGVASFNARTGPISLTKADVTGTALAAADVGADAAGAATAVKGLPVGATGATQATRYVGRWASTGAPASGTFAVGDFGFDGVNSELICTVAGTPGTWQTVGNAAYPTVVAIPASLGDGVQDATATVQAAVTAVAGGGIVYFPPGDYKITSGLTVTANADTDSPSWQGGGVHLVGASARHSRLVSNGAFTLLTFANNLSAFCSIEKMALKGPGKATASSVGVAGNQTPHLRLDQVYIRDFETGVTAYDCTNWTWTDCRAWYCGTILKLGYNCDAHSYLNCEFRNSDLGVLIGWASGAFTGDSQFCTSVAFPGSIIAYNTLGFSLADKAATGVMFDRTYFEGNTKDGEIGVNGRSDLVGPTVAFTGAFFSATTSPPRPVAIDVYGRPTLRMVQCSTDGANRYTVFVKMNDINGGSCLMEDCDIQAATAALQVGSRNWNTTTGKNEGIRWGRRISEHIDTVNLAASIPAKETRLYNGSGRVIEAWGRSTIAGAVTNEFLAQDVGGVLQFGGGSTSAFITATNVAALPTASVNYRGCLAFVAGNGTTTADTLYVCLFAAAGTYSWKSIVAG